MLSNAYFSAKFRFDTAENKPAKNVHFFAKFWKKNCKIGSRALCGDVQKAAPGTRLRSRGRRRLALRLRRLRGRALWAACRIRGLIGIQMSHIRKAKNWTYASFETNIKYMTDLIKFAEYKGRLNNRGVRFSIFYSIPFPP